VTYTDNLEILAKRETVIQGTIDKIIEVVKCYGIEMNVEKSKLMSISGQRFPVQIMID
jgi:hypothetical protein